MMFMDDAVQCAVQLMKADSEKVKVRTSYNITGISFSPQQLAAEIKKKIPEFEIEYQPDFRQEIAGCWPDALDDSEARNDWGW